MAPDGIIAAILGAVVFAFIAVTTRLTPTAMNNYTLVADAWLHGRAWISFPGNWIDAVPYHGRAYIVEAPAPAVFMLPLAWLFGSNANQSVLAAVLTAVAAGAMYRFARAVGDGRADALIVTGFLLFGTSAMSGGMSGDVWMVAHLCALAFTLLALLELTGKRRLWLVTLFGIAAALSRYPLAAALPVYWWLLRDQVRRVRPLLTAVLVALPPLVLWCAYNWSRWGTLHDPGFAIWYRVMSLAAKGHPAMLSPEYLPQQIRSFFFEAPTMLNAFPWTVPKPLGTSLTFASTGLVVAFGVRAREALVIPLVVLTMLTAIPAFLYYDTGGVQFGVRHALDFEPFLLCLVAISLRGPSRRWKRIVLLASAAFGAYLLYVWRVFPHSIS